MEMQDITEQELIKRVECKCCGNSSSSMWRNHRLILVCVDDEFISKVLDDLMSKMVEDINDFRV